MGRLNCVLVFTSLALASAGPSAVADDSGWLTRNPAMRQRAQKSVESIPAEAIGGSQRVRVMQILQKPAVFTQTHVELFPCSPRLFDWLLTHPLWVTEMWQQLGLEVAPVELLDDGYRIADPERGSIEFRVACDRPELRVMYCVAETKRGLLPGALRAEMVIVQRYRFLRRPDGEYLLAQRLEGFVTADGATLRAAMKLAPGTSESVAEQCLQEMMIYFSMMCRIIQIRPEWAMEAAQKLGTTYPDASREEFLEIVSELPEPQEILPAAFHKLLPGMNAVNNP